MTLSAFFLLGAVALAQEPVPEAEPVVAPERSVPPEVVPAAVFELAEPEVSELAPGVALHMVSVPGVRKVEVLVVQHRGSLDLEEWPTPATQVLGWIQDSATERWDLDTLSQHCDLHDIEVASWMDYRDAGVRLEVPLESLNLGLEVLEEVLQRPTFPKREVKRVRRQLENFVLVEGPTDPRSLSSAALAYGWFPAEHPFGSRPDLARWKKVNTAQLLELHATLAAAPVTVLVVGDVTRDQVAGPLAAVVEGLGGEGTEVDEPVFEPPAATRVLAVDLAGAEQVQVALRLDAPLESHPDRAAYEVVNFTLGGAFLSRINTNLREEKGFTYGAYSRYSTHQTRAHWTLRFDTAVPQTAAAVREVEAELALMVEAGLTPDELVQARNSLVSEWNDALQTADSAMGAYGDFLESRQSAGEARAREATRGELTGDDTVRVAGEWFSPERERLWIFVGERSVLEGQLQDLGWVPEWVAPADLMLGQL